MGLRARKKGKAGENYIGRSFVICTLHHIRLITGRRIRWARSVARKGKKEMHTVLAKKPEGKSHLEDLDTDGG